MIRHLILLFMVIVAAVLGLATYHMRSMNALTEQATVYTHWEDMGGIATVQDVVQMSQSEPAALKPIRQRRINLGYTESIHWFRFSLKASHTPEELTFEINNHTIDRLELFEVKNRRITSLGKTGSRLPFAQRPSPTKTFAYLLHVEAGQRVDYMLRVDKRYKNLATELILWRTGDFEDREQRAYLLWGLFSGIVGLVIGLSFLFFGTTKDRLYAYFGLYIFALALRQFADTGLGFQFLWPGIPAINQPDPVIQALWLYLPAMLLFQQHFLELRTESKRAYWITQVFKYALIILFIGLVICQLTGVTETYSGANRLIRQIHTMIANAYLFVSMGNIVVGLRSADTVKRLYSVGFSIQIAGQLLIVAQNITGYRRDGVFFIDAYQLLLVNFFIDLVVFCYLLAYRYRKSRDEQRRLQISLAQTQQHTNQAIIEGLELERQEVGTLIQTDIGGRLTQTRSLLGMVSPVPLLTEAMGLIDKTDDCLEQILRDSLPPDLMRQGLPAALTELIRQRSQIGTVHLSFTHENGKKIPASGLTTTQTQQLYRMANELINNVLKHARASECQVTFRQDPGHWQLTVSDNGKGFDMDSAQNQSGIGLKNLQARAHTLGATLTLTSDKTGTVVRIAG